MIPRLSSAAAAFTSLWPSGAQSLRSFTHVPAHRGIAPGATFGSMHWLVMGLALQGAAAAAGTTRIRHTLMLDQDAAKVISSEVAAAIGKAFPDHEIKTLSVRRAKFGDSMLKPYEFRATSWRPDGRGWSSSTRTRSSVP
jgi:hypothetical protein